jgi:hypothetical protein
MTTLSLVFWNRDSKGSIVQVVRPEKERLVYVLIDSVAQPHSVWSVGFAVGSRPPHCRNQGTSSCEEDAYAHFHQLVRTAEQKSS